MICNKARETMYSITLITCIKWDDVPSGYAGNPDNWIFL